MPEYTTNAKIPVPLWEEGDNIPPDMKRSFEFIDPMLVLRASSEADRNTRYNGVPVGTLVTCTVDKTLWRKEASGWSTLWSSSGWSTVTLINGFQTVSTASAPAWRRIGDVVYWRGLIKLPSDYVGYESGGSPVSGWLDWCTCPADAVPSINGQIFPSYGLAAGENTGGLRYNLGGMSMASAANGSRNIWFGVSMSYPAN